MAHPSLNGAVLLLYFPLIQAIADLTILKAVSTTFFFFFPKDAEVFQTSLRGAPN